MVPFEHRWTWVAAGLCALIVLASFAALAPARVDGPHEPNDTRKQATGPLINAATYSGAIERDYDPASGEPSDTDWFKLFSSGKRPLEVSYMNLEQDPNCFGPEARLLTKRGKLVGTAQPPKDGTEKITAHPQTVRKYYLRVRGYTIEPCAPDDSPYSLEVKGIRKRH